MEFDVGDYLNGALERVKPSANNEVTAVCPSCERWGGFYANAESGAYVCFKCDFRGKSVIGLVAQLEGIDWSEARGFIFKRAVKFRRRETLITLTDRIKLLRPRDEEGESEPTRAVDYDIPAGVIPCYDPKTDKWKLPPYLKERGLKTRTIRAWGLGYSKRLWMEYPGRDKPYNLSDRLFIPIICPAGHSWTGRDMVGGRIPRYFNPPGADHRRLLIGWHAARLTGDVTICEGPLDAIRLWQHDITALALGGKELHDEQLAQLMDLSPETAVTVMLDPEEVIAPLTVARRLSLHFKNIYLAKLPLGVDPGSSTRAQAHAALDGAKKWDGGRSAYLAAVLERARNSLDSKRSRKK
jgi:DNA primase